MDHFKERSIRTLPDTTWIQISLSTLLDMKLFKLDRIWVHYHCYISLLFFFLYGSQYSLQVMRRIVLRQLLDLMGNENITQVCYTDYRVHLMYQKQCNLHCLIPHYVPVLPSIMLVSTLGGSF